MSLPNLKLWQHSKNGHWVTPISSTNYPYKFSDPLANQIEHFCNVIKKKEKPIITASIAKDTIDEVYYWIGRRKIASSKTMGEKLSKKLEGQEITSESLDSFL